MGDRMRLAEIVNGLVVNVIEVDDRPDWASDWPDAGAASPGWIEVAGDLLPPEQAPAVPEVISKLQGILTLGQDRWSVVLDYRASARWSEQVVIDSASDWYRNSENIAFFQHLLGLTDSEVDALFISASQIRA